MIVFNQMKFLSEAKDNYHLENLETNYCNLFFLVYMSNKLIRFIRYQHIMLRTKKVICYI